MEKKFTEIEFEQLFRLYFKPLVNFANKFLNNLDDSKEIVHDAFVSLWNKRDTIDINKSVKSYLYTSVNNKCLNFIRDHKKFTRTEDAPLLELSEETPDMLTAMEIESIINETLEQMSEKVRKVFVLSRYENLKYREIAEKLNISEKTVESHISKALKMLRENLKEYLPVLLLLILESNLLY